MKKSRRNQLILALLVVAVIVIWEAAGRGSEESGTLSTEETTQEIAVLEESTEEESTAGETTEAVTTDTEAAEETASTEETTVEEEEADAASDAVPVETNLSGNPLVDNGSLVITMDPQASTTGFTDTIEISGGTLENVVAEYEFGDYRGVLESGPIEEGEKAELAADDAPMESCEDTGTIIYTCSVEGETDPLTLTIEMDRFIPDETLQEFYWNAGTFDTIADSVNYHFGKHHEEVDAADIGTYILMADETREEAAADDGTAFRVTKSQGELPAHKYKNYDDDRFIILTDDGYEILSFGR